MNETRSNMSELGKHLDPHTEPRPVSHSLFRQIKVSLYVSFCRQIKNKISKICSLDGNDGDIA